MADTFYGKAAEAFLNGEINMLTDDIRVILIDAADYTPNFATDEFLTIIPMAARVAVTAADLTSKTTTLGFFDADDTTFGNVTGDQSEAIVLYQHTGVDATSRLICWLDSLTGLPITPNGGPISLSFGAYIFQIAGVCP